MLKFSLFLLSLFIYQINTLEFNELSNKIEDSSQLIIKQTKKDLGNAEVVDEGKENSNSGNELKKKNELHVNIKEKSILEEISQYDELIAPQMRLPKSFENWFHNWIKKLKSLKNKRSEYSREYLDLRSRILASHAKGDESLLKLLTGKGFYDVYEGLNEKEREEIDSLVSEIIQSKSKRSVYSKEYLDLRSRILASHANGEESLLKLLTGKGFYDVYEGLNEKEREEIDSLVSEIIQSKKKRSVYSREYLDLRSRMLSSYAKGQKSLLELLNGKGFLNVYDGLNEKEREAIDSLIVELVQSKKKRAMYSREYLDLRSRILASHAKGDESLLKFLTGKGFYDVYEGLNEKEREEIGSLVSEIIQSKNKRSVYSREYLDLRSRVLASHAKGDESLLKLLTGKGFYDVYEGLNEKEREEIDLLVSEIIQTKKSETKRLSNSKEYLDLRNRILVQHVKGNKNLLKFLSSQGFSDVVSSLNNAEEEEIYELIKKLNPSYQSKMKNSSLFKDYLYLRSRSLTNFVWGNNFLVQFLSSKMMEGLSEKMELEIYVMISDIIKKLLQKLHLSEPRKLLIQNCLSCVYFAITTTQRKTRSEYSQRFLDLRKWILSSFHKGNLTLFIRRPVTVDLIKQLNKSEQEEINELIENLLAE